MWRIWNRLFGLDYVQIEYGFGTKIRRVQYMPSNAAYITVYGEVMPIDPNGVMGRYPYKYIPLTWADEITDKRNNLKIVTNQ